MAERVQEPAAPNAGDGLTTSVIHIVDPSDESDSIASDAARLVARLPTLSQKEASAKLEELLYEHRASIEGSEAFCNAVASADTDNFEMQDIKVQRYRREENALVVDFAYWAIGEQDEEREGGADRIDGLGIGDITNQGRVEIHNVTAAISGT